MNYVEELKPILSLPESFLKELNYFFINSNLSKQERSRLVDIIQNKKWVVNYDNETTDWIIQNKGVEMGKVKIQTKKAIINIPSNDLTINLHLGKDKENKQNLEIIKSL